MKVTVSLPLPAAAQLTSRQIAFVLSMERRCIYSRIGDNNGRVHEVGGTVLIKLKFHTKYYSMDNNRKKNDASMTLSAC